MSDRQKIAFLCHPYHRGGVTRWMADAAIAFAKNSYEVYFITVDPVKPFYSGKDREKMVELVADCGEDINIVSAGVDFTFEFGTENYRSNIYKSLIERQIPIGVPIIISDDVSIWKAAAAVADKYPMIGVLHGNNDNYFGKAKTYQLQLSICVSVSKRIGQAATRVCDNIDIERKFVVIPCGITFPDFEPVIKHDNILRLIFIGRLTDTEKRAYDLVKICALLHKKGIVFQLDIVGNSENSTIEFYKYFKDEGVDGFVSFHGWLSKEKIKKLLDGSDILLLTSNSEGMPLVMMEALASGCGFTGTRVSGIEDYEDHPLAPDCFSVYTVGDIEDAVNKINKVAAIPVSARRSAARELAESEFSMKVCLDRYSKAIASIQHTGTTVTPDISLSAAKILYSKVIAVARYLKVRLKP